MGLISRLLDANRSKKSVRVAQELRQAFYQSPLCSDYENMFSQVRPLIEEMETVMPYGVGKNGARLPISRTPELALLQDPNESMGWVEFADTMFSTWLTEDQLFIHVHHDNGKVKGYTILPPNSRFTNGEGIFYWQVNTTNGLMTLGEDEVMTLCFSRNPSDLTKGVSPASAVRIWAQIDDLIGQYQRAFFENGAVPATITFITASTEDKYRETRHELETGLKGARNRNKTIYAWRQMLPDTGETADQIEVKTIQGSNSTLAIKDLVSIVNDKLNKSVGVSNFILGDDSSAKYDNAELSDHQFTKRRVYPALLRFWNQFQHELDRITGGLGYGIQFSLELPELTERNKTKAQIAQTNVANLISLIQAGAKPAGACEALGLSDKWLSVGAGIYNRVLADQELLIGGSNTNIEESSTVGFTSQLPAETPHTSCQHHATVDDYRPFADDEKLERRIYNKLMSLAKAIFEDNPNFDVVDLEAGIYKMLEKEAERGGMVAVEAIKKLIDDDQELESELQKLIDSGVGISEALEKRIHERVSTIVDSFNETTKGVLKSVLEGGEALTAEEIEARLYEVMPRAKAATIARNETVYAFKSGRLDLDERMEQRYGLKIELVWRTSPEAGDVCPVCAGMDGKVTKVGHAFSDRVKTDDGEIVWEQSAWNDYGAIPNAHTNCKCYFDERLVRE